MGSSPYLADQDASCFGQDPTADSPSLLVVGPLKDGKNFAAGLAGWHEATPQPPTR